MFACDARRAFTRPRDTRRKAYFGKEYGLLDTPVIVRSALDATPHRRPADHRGVRRHDGVPPGARAVLDAYDNIVITLETERAHAA